MVSNPSDESLTGVSQRVTQYVVRNSKELVPCPNQSTPRINHCFRSGIPSECLQVVFIFDNMRFLKVADGKQRKGILIILTHKIGIGKSLNLYQGQVRKVKGQGQIGVYKQNFN